MLYRGEHVDVAIGQTGVDKVRIEQSMSASGAFVSLIGPTGQLLHWHLDENTTFALIAALRRTVEG